jgi:hypothetical protein
MEYTPIKRMEAGHRLNTAEAAAYIGLSASTLSKLRVFGGGPRYFKCGRRCIYDSVDLDRFLESRARTSTSDAGDQGAAL